MSAYLLGLVTLPVLALTSFLALVSYWRVEAYLDRRLGVSWEVRMKRDLEGISPYTLQNNIWFERRHGPIFVGHWCRHEHRIEKDVATRWIGFGGTDGPCITVFRKRVLGESV